MKIVAVFHGAKVEGLQGLNSRLGANPPMTMTGMSNILDLVPILKTLGPFDFMYVSRLARALDAASIIALELDMDFETKRELGQFGNKDGSNVIMYPGHEADGYKNWQSDGLVAIDEIWDEIDEVSSEDTILIVSHRPIIGGLVAACQEIEDEDGIKAVVNDPSLTEKGYVIFRYNGRKLTLEPEE